MPRRRRLRDGEECTCDHSQCEADEGRRGYTPHHYGCLLWGEGDRYIVGVTKPMKSLLGSKRVPYEKWAAKVSLYSWPLWRNWQPPKPLRVETAREIEARQIGKKARASFIASVLAVQWDRIRLGYKQVEWYEAAPKWRPAEEKAA